MALSNLSLFLMCVAIWGSTWIAITFQLGNIQPAASIFYRFLLAALILLAFCRLRRLNLRFGPRQHVALMLQGVLMFSLSYLASTMRRPSWSPVWWRWDSPPVRC